MAAGLSDLLTPYGQSSLARLGGSRSPLIDEDHRFATLDGWLKPSWARRRLTSLDAGFTGCLGRVNRPIPASTISSMRKNYSEQLPKTMSVDSVVLDRPRSKAWRTACSLGIVDLLDSAALRGLAESATGLALNEMPGMQVLRYSPGDYTGPHNDHHPEWADTRDGFVDVHLSVSSGVAHQWLVYEHKGHFTETVSLVTSPMLSVYRLPFWHFTTPLVPRARCRGSARRWVLMASYTIA